MIKIEEQDKYYTINGGHDSIAFTEEELLELYEELKKIYEKSEN